jgi:hypothetical protein
MGFGTEVLFMIILSVVLGPKTAAHGVATRGADEARDEVLAFLKTDDPGTNP